MSDFRIGTWNVEYARGELKNRARREHLVAQMADVWILTETHDELDLSGSHIPIHSEQRYPKPGGRWTTVWTSLPVIQRIPTSDPRRSVAVRLDAGNAGEVIVYGTVLPWNGDAGVDRVNPARGWTEFRRVVPLQGREWASLREEYPWATLVVAGDLNQDLGGAHYYGSRECRGILGTALSTADLTCLATTDRFAPGVLQHPPIDHVCAGPGHHKSLTSRVHGWDNVIDGLRLSDHSGVLVDLDVGDANELH